MLGRKRNGVCPSHYCRSSGSVARKALQSLEALKLIEKTPDGGRKLTSQGQRDIDRIAAQIRPKRKDKAGTTKASDLPVPPPPVEVAA